MWSKFMSCTLFYTWSVVGIKFLHKKPFYISCIWNKTYYIFRNIEKITDNSNMYFMWYQNSESHLIHLYLKIFYIKVLQNFCPMKTSA